MAFEGSLEDLALVDVLQILADFAGMAFDLALRRKREAAPSSGRSGRCMTEAGQAVRN